MLGTQVESSKFHHAVFFVAKVSSHGAKAHKGRAFGALRARSLGLYRLAIADRAFLGNSSLGFKKPFPARYGLYDYS